MSEMALPLTCAFNLVFEPLPDRSGVSRTIDDRELCSKILGQQMCGSTELHSRADSFCHEEFHPYIWAPTLFSASPHAVALPRLKSSVLWQLHSLTRNNSLQKPSKFLWELYYLSESERNDSRRRQPNECNRRALAADTSSAREIGEKDERVSDRSAPMGTLWPSRDLSRWRPGSGGSIHTSDENNASSKLSEFCPELYYLQAPQMAALEDGKSMNLIEALRSRTTYLGTNDVMALIGVTRNTLCQWVREGKIGAIRTGNAYLFDPHTLADWLSDRETKTGILRRAA